MSIRKSLAIPSFTISDPHRSSLSLQAEKVSIDQHVASMRPITIDEDAPELTLEQYAEMAAMAKARRSKNVKPVVALRISPDTLDKAKATGKGYAGFLSRLLDNAINDLQMVAKSL